MKGTKPLRKPSRKSKLWVISYKRTPSYCESEDKKLIDQWIAGDGSKYRIKRANGYEVGERVYFNFRDKQLKQFPVYFVASLNFDGRRPLYSILVNKNVELVRSLYPYQEKWN